jgi:uncharacterized repeat protein (TIGR03943 family)
MIMALRASRRQLAILLPALVYFLWLGEYLWLLHKGRYKAYLQPSLWPLLVVAVLIILLFIYSTIRGQSRAAHPHGVGSPWIQIALLALPLVFLGTVYGKTFGTHTLSKRSMDLGVMATSSMPLVEDRRTKNAVENGPVEKVTLLELKIDRREELLGKQVLTEGMVWSDPQRLKDFLLDGLPEGCFVLFRFRVVCCAADAVPIGVLTCGNEARNLKDDEWVNVQGQYGLRTIGRDAVPCIQVEAVNSIPAPPPSEQFLFRQRWSLPGPSKP